MTAVPILPAVVEDKPPDVAIHRQQPDSQTTGNRERRYHYTEPLDDPVARKAMTRILAMAIAMTCHVLPM